MGWTTPDDELAPRVLTVTELSRRLAALVAGLGRVSVQGEVSRAQRAASGHLYFDLKDLDSKISCTVWKSQLASALRFDLTEGQQVVVHGKLDVYAPRGTYSLIAQRIEPAGRGALLESFERLKQELAARGWFERKRALPSLPRAIGVATSRDGAALQDFLRTRSLRWPLYPVVLAHTPVQGSGAAIEIARAIGALGRAGVEVIVVCRGGGSLEDLWAFNELPVAEAIWNSPVPVISGVGHQTDVTLADLVADHRAHTPTDAAQTAIPDRAERIERLLSAGNRLSESAWEAWESRSERLLRAARAPTLARPESLLAQRATRLAELAQRIARDGEQRMAAAGSRLERAHRDLVRLTPSLRVERARGALTERGVRLRRAFEAELDRRRRGFELAGAKLDALSPLKGLARGYSITTRAGQSAPIRDARSLANDELLETRLARGTVVSRVERTDPGVDRA